MSSVFRFESGPLPLLISVPHDGREIPDELQSRMTEAGLSIPDTDWHVAQLYEFARNMGANILIANQSRYVVDLNRSAEDVELYPGQVATGLCPEHTFSGAPIYSSGGVDEAEKAQRLTDFWWPYHEKIRTTLDSLRAGHGVALLWDAHSIPSEVPRLFDGALPELNLGSDSGKSCGREIEMAVANIAMQSDYSAVINGRFKGGHITRQYGDTRSDVHALQLEIAQRAYMNEETTAFDTAKAKKLRDTLQKMLGAFLDAAAN